MRFVAEWTRKTVIANELNELNKLKKKGKKENTQKEKQILPQPLVKETHSN